MMLQKIVNERINKQRNDDYFASYIDDYFNTWCRLHSTTNYVQIGCTLMKGTWVHVFTVWVSQLHV